MVYIFYFQLGFSIFRGQNLYWRRRSNCFLNFYTLLYYLLQKRRDVQNRRRHLDTTNSSTNHGHHHASDFIYASPYELIEKHQNAGGSNNNNNVDPNNNNTSEIYFPASISLRMTPPPLPQVYILPVYIYSAISLLLLVKTRLFSLNF